MTNTIARHCSAEDTETHQVFEVDGGDLKTTISEAAKFIAELGERDFEVEYQADSSAWDEFEVFLFTVAK